MPNSSSSPTVTETDPGATQSLTTLKRQCESVRIYTVYVIAGPEPSQYQTIYPGERALIGRGESCEVTLHDVRVSRQHAALSCDDSGEVLTLEDLSSLNGTFLNGMRVEKNMVVQHGDELRIGDVTLRVDLMGIEALSHLARQVERIKLASSDPLTGLLARQQLDQVLPDQIKRRHQGGIPVSMIFLDIDYFKQINDNFGHILGDEVLRTVARLIALCIREIDSAVRYGGDELLIFLMHCDEKGAYSIAQRLQKRVAEYNWSQHANTNGETLRVGLSAGVAQYGGESMPEWIDRADRALYEAKRRGRGCSVRWSEL